MKISEKFKELKERGEKALILYISCGDPSIEETINIAHSVVAAGCDILELGLPFSDPLADGPTIQTASQHAIAAGMNTDKYFEVCKRIDVPVPKVCMTYYNLIFNYGLERFAKSCVESGITSIVVPDLPAEEAGPLQKACNEKDIDLIYVISPYTSEKRLALIKASPGGPRGFLYLQSVLGVTGARESMKVELGKKIEQLKKTFGLPVAVGFGIATPEQVKDLVGQGADGIIVGSALVRRIDEHSDFAAFVKSLQDATK